MHTRTLSRMHSIPPSLSLRVLTVSHPLLSTRSFFVAQQLSEADRPHCHSLRSFFLHRRHSGRLRIPADIKNWRTRLQPIRTIGEITAHIKILPARLPYLYQKLSRKATQLRLLGMTYRQIAESLYINRKTAIKACKYQGR